VDFVARNGLAFGSWCHLTGAAPTTKGETTNGKFSESFFFAMYSDHCEDIHTNPLHPSQVTLCEEKHGVCIFDFNLSFSSMDGSFQPKSSTFSVTMVVNDDQVPMKATDNVVWTENSLVHVATDGSNAGLWQMSPDGSNLVEIAPSKNGGVDHNPSGVMGISNLSAASLRACVPHDHHELWLLHGCFDQP